MEIYVKENDQIIASDDYLKSASEAIRKNLSKLINELKTTKTLSGPSCDFDGDDEWVVQVQNDEGYMQIFRIGILTPEKLIKKPVIDHRDRVHPPIVKTVRDVIIKRPKDKIEFYVNDGYTRDIRAVDFWTLDEFSENLSLSGKRMFFKTISELRDDKFPAEIKFTDPETKKEIVCTAELIMRPI